MIQRISQQGSAPRSQSSAETPWTGNLSVDLRKGALSVSADGLTLIDEKNVCWGIVFPNKEGFYEHAAFIAKAASNYVALVKALKDAQRIIERDFPNGQLVIDIRAALTQANL